MGSTIDHGRVVAQTGGVDVLWVGFRAEFRTRWRAMAAIVLFIGLAGGISVAAAAGARRTSTVVDRLRVASHVYDVALNPIADVPTEKWAQVDQLPQVRLSAFIPGVIAMRLDDNGEIDFTFLYSGHVAIIDPKVFHEIDRPRVVEGRLPSGPDEAIVNVQAAKMLHLAVGDQVDVRFFDPSMVDTDPSTPFLVDAGIPGTASIVGIVLLFDELLKDPNDLTLAPFVLFGPSAYHPELAPPYEIHEYLLHGGDAAVSGFVAQARRIVGDNAFVVQESGAATARANNSLRPYVFSLALVALLVFVAGFLLIAQALAREERRYAQQHATMRALGLSERQLLMSSAVRNGLIAVCGAALAVAIAVLVSPLMPLGDARSLEIDRGMQFDPLVGLGFVLIVLLVMAMAGVSAWSQRSGRNRPPATARNRARVWRDISPVSAVGLSFAFETRRLGSSRTSRSFSSLVCVLAIMVAALVFGANLVRFATTSVRYGWPWGVIIPVQDGDGAAIATQLEADPSVVAVQGYHGLLGVGGQSIPAVGLGHGGPGASVPIIEGRAPVADDEVVLGRASLTSLHTRVGESIEVGAGDATLPLKVVGVGVFPRFAPYPSSEPSGLGIGSELTAEGLTRLGQEGGIAGTFFLVSGTGGQAVDAAALDDRLFGGDVQKGSVYGEQRPVEVRGYFQMRVMPLLLVVVLGLLLLGALANLLVSGSRQRHRDIAVLRALGFTRGQVRRTIVVQLLATFAVVAVIATPVGLVVGGGAWRLTARWLGIADDTAFPVAELALMMTVLLGFGLAIAAVTGTRAARRSVQRSLITE